MATVFVFVPSGREGHEQGPLEEAKFKNRYTGVKTYYIFTSPFYRIEVGDFRTFCEAMKFLKKTEPDYKDIAFIIGPRKINYPEL